MKRGIMIGGVVVAAAMLAGTVRAAPPAADSEEGSTDEARVNAAVAAALEQAETDKKAKAAADAKANGDALTKAKLLVDEARHADADKALAELKANDSTLSEEQRKQLDLLITKLRYDYGSKQELAFETSDDGAKISQRLGCTNATTLCVRGDGSPFANDALGPWVDGGDAIAVRVVGCKETYGKATFEVTANAIARNERLFRELYPQAVEKSGGPRAYRETKSLLDFCKTPNDMVTIHQGAVEVTDDPTKDGLRITVTRKATQDGAIPEASNAHTTRIEHGRYFLDVGVMVPLVFGGDQTVVAVPLEQTPTSFALTERTNLLVSPAVVLNVFPGGRERGKIGSFTGYACPRTHKKKKKKSYVLRAEPSCRQHRDRRRTANSLGLQIGVDVDLSKFDRMFFGPMFEPVSGLTLGAGVAAVKVERLTEGTSAGRIVDPEQRSTFTRSRFTARPYVSVTFSLDIIRNLAGFRGRSRSE
ncbi:MAG: hypothetical protein AB1Z98_23385 [Nannocystaceae bacterium]